MGKISLLLIGLLSFSGFGSALEQPYQRLSITTSKTLAHSRSKNWDPGKERVLEVSGMEWFDDHRLILTTRKGDVLILHNPNRSHLETPKYTLFASGLHEPLGIAKRGDSFYVTQRGEVTELIDRDGDERADAYFNHSSPWDISGNYHEYAYGPKVDQKGNLWVTLNLGMGKLSNPKTAWRGWGIRLDQNGKAEYIAGGMRSPSGLGMNHHDDVFFTDQQGHYVPTNTLHHLRHGAFYGHPEAIESARKNILNVGLKSKLPNDLPYPNAIKKVPSLVSPTVWFPYIKMGRSATDVVCDQTNGKFGPFKNQLFVGEFTHSGINRVFLEKVNGVYQGACFPFMRDFPAGVVRLKFSKDGSLYVGMTNRGWNSTGGGSFGLQRVIFQQTPFEILKMEALTDGFRVTFTKPISKKVAMDLNSYKMMNYTYNYSSKYGGAEVLKQGNSILQVKMLDKRSVELKVDGLKQYHVHELLCEGIVDLEGNSLLHPEAYYTLNEIPER